MEENKENKVINQYFKINFNEMSDEIFEIISKSKSKQAQENGFQLAMQYQVFTNYLKVISKNAIEKNDKITLFALNQIGVLTNVESEELEEMQIEYEKFSEHLKSPKKEIVTNEK